MLAFFPVRFQLTSILYQHNACIENENEIDFVKMKSWSASDVYMCVGWRVFCERSFFRKINCWLIGKSNRNFCEETFMLLIARMWFLTIERLWLVFVRWMKLFRMGDVDWAWSCYLEWIRISAQKGWVGRHTFELWNNSISKCKYVEWISSRLRPDGDRLWNFAAMNEMLISEWQSIQQIKHRQFSEGVRF